MSKYYIARDNDNSLWVYTEMPFRNDFSWNSDGGAYEIDESLFPEVKWEDKEPKVLTIADNMFIKIEDRLSNNNEE